MNGDIHLQVCIFGLHYLGVSKSGIVSFLVSNHSRVAACKAVSYNAQSEWHLLAAARIIAGGSRSLSAQTSVVMDRGYLPACSSQRPSFLQNFTKYSVPSLSLG